MITSSSAPWITKVFFATLCICLSTYSTAKPAFNDTSSFIQVNVTSANDQLLPPKTRSTKTKKNKSKKNKEGLKVNDTIKHSGESNDLDSTLETSSSSTPPSKQNKTNAAILNTSKADKKTGKSDKSTKIPPVVLIVAFLAVAVIIRKKITKVTPVQYSPIKSDEIADTDTSFTYGVSVAKNVSSRFNTEKISVSSATNDEWGWEDGNDDIELAQPRRNVSPKNSPSTEAKIKPSPAVFRQNRSLSDSKESVSIKSKEKDSWDEESDWGDTSRPNSITKQTSITSTPNDIESLMAETKASHGFKITSLGKKSSPPAQRKTREPAEDDIFASMGLCAKPKQFSSNSISSNSTEKTSSSTKLARDTSAMAADDRVNVVSDSQDNSLEYMRESDQDSNWDDDGDLDDLLDD